MICNNRIIPMLLLVTSVCHICFHSQDHIIGVDCQIIFNDDERKQDSSRLASTTMRSNNRSSSSTSSSRSSVNGKPARVSKNSNNNNKLPNTGRSSSRCTTYDSKLGDCIAIDSCESLRNQSPDILRKSTCGFQDDGLPLVCCQISTPDGGDQQELSTVETIHRTEPTVTTNGATNGPEEMSPSGQDSLSVDRSKFLKVCGATFDTALRIVGGQPAVDNAWPWFALLMIDRGKGTRNPECGATLINDRFVMTASHCVVEQPGNTPVDKSKILVRLGEQDLKVDNDHTDIEVAEVIAHPDYEASTFKNDIALIRLSKQVNFSEGISPVCLPFDHEKLRSATMVNQTAWVIGFGRLNYNGRPSTVLRQADLKIVSQESCAKAFRNVLELNINYVCAAGTGDTHKDSCQGDSGGPLLMLHPEAACCRWYIYGIVSFGYRCATAGYPGIYTRVNKYLDWIESKI